MISTILAFRRLQILGFPRESSSTTFESLSAAALLATASALHREKKKQGYVSINNLQKVGMSGAGGSVFFSWVKRIALACFWASLIAAGQLVYTHFTKKWEEKGLPYLPIMGLRAPPGAGPATFNLGSGTTSTAGQATYSASSPVTKGLMDEYQD